MNRGIYSIASGMLASQQQMAVVSNNLANVNTSGFKADQLAFNDALERTMVNSANQTIGTLGAGGTVKQQYTDLGQGAINPTGNSLDLAISGNGMFAVQGPSGQVMYTRNGSFTTTSEGTLVNNQGYPVLDSAQRAIQIRPGPVSIGSDGSVSSGSGGTAYAKIGLFQGTPTKRADGFYDTANATLATGRNGTATVKQGSLESSNVSPISGMVDMINLSRTFELSQKSIQSEDEMSQSLSTILN
jgi:flagellar basal body rod protein FlgG